MALEFSGPGVPLSALAFAEAAETLGVHAPEVWAVLTVETRGLGFLPDRRPLILFERHVFHRETGGRHDRTDPAVSDAEPGGYTEGPHEYDRLQQAVRLDRTAALRSASWGIGQVMGFNSAKAGYPTVGAMVADMTRSEDVQLKAMVGEIRSGNLDRFLRVHDWTSFARGYNGVNFARNQYDARLAAAHQRFAQGPLPDLAVRQGQAFLVYLGFRPGPVDGIMGRRTRAAIGDFQRGEGLPSSGEMDDATLDRLRARTALPA